MGFQPRLFAAALALIVVFSGFTSAADEPPASSDREIPEQFAPFEYMIGSWKGTGFYLANRVRGWQETHAWAWKFEKGTPVGLNVVLTGNKVVEKAFLSFDSAAKTYTLEGTGPGDTAVKFTGKLDASGKTLTFDRVGKNAEGARERLAISPNANFVRYTLKVASQEAGAPQYKPSSEVGLTKEGEQFAAGGGGDADLPKCIITGGASTLTVTYQGKSYPLCCTGCRDEFNDNPEKYIKKAALNADAAGKAKVMTATVTTPVPPAAEDEAKPAKPSATKADSKPANSAAVDEKRAQGLLKSGQNLEKREKIKPALEAYRQIVKDFPKSSAAKTAAERIKALGTP